MLRKGEELLRLVDIKLPQQGASMTDGDIMEWFVEEGDDVEKGQDIVNVEAAKVNFNIQAPVSGVVKSIKVEEDENVEVGTILAVIETEEE